MSKGMFYSSILQMSKIMIIYSLSCCSLVCKANTATIDKDVSAIFNKHSKEKFLSLIVFFNSEKNIPQFLRSLKSPSIHTERLNFMPTVLVVAPKHIKTLKYIAAFPSVRYIAINKPASEKIEINVHNKKVKKEFLYSGIDLWWAQNFKGQSGIVGIIDSGIASDHPALIDKKIIINKRKYSGFSSYPKGVRSPHGTGVACIYAGHPLKKEDNVRGVSYKAPIILSTIAGEGNAKKENFWLTYSGLNWFFSLSPIKPSVINYSFGNGEVSCPTCPDWSGMSKVVDYIVNKHKILWVTSAGNDGYSKQKQHSPFSSTMTIPADNYNALTVANMNMYGEEQTELAISYPRKKHTIRYTSSRGPTLLGRKKPDLTAPGNNTYTCAPNPDKYDVNYAKGDGYEKGYRLMGGTSSAAPHVGGAILIIQEAGIVNPMAIKALLINSADAWTDSNKPGPNDPAYPYLGGHHPQLGSEWNPTYGWGYMNMKKAFYQKDNIIEEKLSIKNPIIEYKTKMLNKDKITVIHERRVGFNKNGTPWVFSHLKLEVYELKNHNLLAEDASLSDTVHQVSLCNAKSPAQCAQLKPKDVIVRISLVSPVLEGSDEEPFALVFSSNYPFKKSEPLVAAKM